MLKRRVDNSPHGMYFGEMQKRPPLDAATIFGLVGATIVTGLLGWWLKSISHEIPLPAFLAICAIGCLVCILGALWLDRRS